MSTGSATRPAADLTAEFRVPGDLRLPRQADRRGVRPAYAPIPLPPTDNEKYAYRRRRLGLLTACSVVSFGCLMASQVLMLRMSPWLWLLVPFFIMTIAFFIVSTIVNIRTPAFNLKAHRGLVEDWSPERYPSVDVFLPVCGEPAHVLTNTWEFVRQMVGAYPGRVDVHVLDDSADEFRRRVALSFGFNYFRRPDRGWYKKAGNLRYGFGYTFNDYILILDADFTPRSDLLSELLPYFDADPQLGIVQSPQFFRVHKGQGWVERGAGAVQELFYRALQVARDHHGAAICVGSCALYRRTALDAIGGTALIEHSEDVHTGFDLRIEGWGLRYVPIVLAAGLCPTDVDSFYTQQYRWCSGSMTLLGSGKFWRLKLPVRARLSYISGFFYYVHTALFTLAAPLVPIVLLVSFPEAVVLANYALILPSIIYTIVIFPLWHRARYGLNTFTVKMICGWAHLFAIWDIARGRAMSWQPTGGSAKKSQTRRLWLGMRIWTLGAGLLWTGLAAAWMLGDQPVDYIPMFLVGAFFLLVACQAVFVLPARDVEVVM